jgi:hypothetical protein
MAGDTFYLLYGKRGEVNVFSVFYLPIATFVWADSTLNSIKIID